MFDKVKQGKELLKLRSEAKKIQQELEKITHTEEVGIYKIKANGSMPPKLVYAEVDGEESRDLVEAVNKAIEEAQKKAAPKMLEMSGGLGGILGGK